MWRPGLNTATREAPQPIVAAGSSHRHERLHSQLWRPGLHTATREAPRPMWRPGLQTRLAEHRISPLGGSVVSALRRAGCWTCVVAACLIAAQPAPAGAQEPGEALYAKRCAMCHDKDVPRAPRRETLRLMSPEAILGALQGGTMAPQAVGLTLAEGGRSRPEAERSPGTARQPGRCSAGAPAFAPDGPEWAGWGAGPENARFQPKPGLTPANMGRLRVLSGRAVEEGRRR